MSFATIDDLQRALATHDYVADRPLATAIFLALKRQKPLLLEGEAGVGKTEVAKTLAQMLGRRLIRLLVGPMGPRIAQMGLSDSNMHRVSKAVSWLRHHFDEPADVEELARLVNMSLSAFHRQFRAVTSMSPLQFQKALRLQEARRLMLTSMLDASAAGRRVGYISASQCSREYGRFFGSAPTKDIHRRREEGHAAAEAPP